VTAESAPQQPAHDIASTLTEAASLINAGQNREAATLLKRISIWSSLSDPRADYLLGVAAFRSDDLRTAAVAFRRCIAADPHNGPAQYGLAKILQAQGDHEGARQAFAAAEHADPSIAAARQSLHASTGTAGKAPSDRSSSPHNFPPSAETAGADSAAESLADILDRNASERPGPAELAGEIIWKGRPALRSIIAPTIGPFLLLVVPLAIRNATEAIPAGAMHDAAAQLWRLTMSTALLLAIILSATSVVNWLMRELIIRERRLEVWTGLFGHRHVMLWLHDLERPLIIKQPFWQLALNLGTLQITSTILPTPRRRRAATRMGHLRFSGLPIQEAEKVAEVIWSRSLWERRRLVKNFISNR
jgi:Tetratricopeptide repeat